MAGELKRNGVELRKHVMVEKVLVEEAAGGKRVAGVVANGRTIRCSAVLSNANIKGTILKLAGGEHFPPEFVECIFVSNGDGAGAAGNNGL